MFNTDIVLDQVDAGILLLLEGDPLLEPRKATQLFCEPGRVIAVHRGRTPDEKAFLRNRGTIIRALGSDQWTGREISLEMTGRHGRPVLVLFPDHRHMVLAINRPDASTLVGATATVKQVSATSPERPIADPATGHVHDRCDLSAYRLPAFWRDASVVWFALPPDGSAGSARTTNSCSSRRSAASDRPLRRTSQRAKRRSTTTSRSEPRRCAGRMPP